MRRFNDTLSAETHHGVETSLLRSSLKRIRRKKSGLQLQALLIRQYLVRLFTKDLC